MEKILLSPRGAGGAGTAYRTSSSLGVRAGMVVPPAESETPEECDPSPPRVVRARGGVREFFFLASASDCIGKMAAFSPPYPPSSAPDSAALPLFFPLYPADSPRQRIKGPGDPFPFAEASAVRSSLPVQFPFPSPPPGSASPAKTPSGFLSFPSTRPRGVIG